MIRRIILVSLLLSVFLLKAQNQKLGSIVYEKHTFMGNKHLKPSDSIVKKEKERFEKFVKKHIDSVNSDTFINSIPKPLLEVNGGEMKCLYTLDIYENFYHSKSKCDYIKYDSLERYQEINKHTLIGNAVVRNIKRNKYKTGQKFKVRELVLSDTYEIVENRNITKIIEGYTCFQVLVKRKNISNPHLTIYDFEIYVTEQIKLNYNPVWNYKEFLNNYYPLEITKKPREEKMVQMITWKIKKLSLSSSIKN